MQILVQIVSIIVCNLENKLYMACWSKLRSWFSAKLSHSKHIHTYLYVHIICLCITVLHSFEFPFKPLPTARTWIKIAQCDTQQKGYRSKGRDHRLNLGTITINLDEKWISSACLSCMTFMRCHWARHQRLWLCWAAPRCECNITVWMWSEYSWKKDRMLLRESYVNKGKKKKSTQMKCEAWVKCFANEKNCNVSSLL